MQPIESLFKNELKATYTSYKNTRKSYYPAWKTEYEIYVKMQACPLEQKDFASWAWINALTWQMLYGQPVLYEFKNLAMPVLIIVGQEDRTIPGKNCLVKNSSRFMEIFLCLLKKQRIK